MKMWYRKKLRKRHLLPEVTLTPLIDTALCLLIIFMVTSQVISHKNENALSIELPRGNVKEIAETQLQDVVVMLDKKGSISINGKIVSDQKVVESLKLIVQVKHKTVFVKADIGASYGKVIELVDKIKQIEGVLYVALATTKID